MKKKLLALALGLVVVLTTACGAKNSDNKNTENKEGVKVVKIGVSPEPHQKLVELVKEDLEKEGIKLDIVTFTDYIQPNLALDGKELDLNFFQHKPYLDEFNNKKNTKLSVLGNVHVEPMGLYLNNASKIKDGAEIAIPNDPSNGARALILLDKNGIIKLKDNTNILSSVNDITENPKKIKFIEVEAAQLPRIIKDIDGAVINGNYAIEAGLSPTKDAKLIEGKDSPYANIITVRTGEENNETYKKVLKALEVGIDPILCCGETLEEREAGITLTLIKKQIVSALKYVSPENAQRCIIAYEPIWAIGTGRVATTQQAQEVCCSIRGIIRDIYGTQIADAIRILYGGSVNAGNALQLFSEPDIDGGLVGGASLKPEFSKIVNYQ